LRKVTAAFLNAIPGIFSVVGVMCVFYYTMGVVATIIFGKTFPQWFGHLGRSLYSLFQIMTLEGWSESIVRKVMEVYPYAWAFFIPFIIIATFTIMNLFVGVIVAAMSELAITPSPTPGEARILRVLEHVRLELQDLRRREQERTSAMLPPAMIPPTDPGPCYPQPQGRAPLHERSP
jgi:voltage-gated sodium channel